MIYYNETDDITEEEKSYIGIAVLLLNIIFIFMTNTAYLYATSEVKYEKAIIYNVYSVENKKLIVINNEPYLLEYPVGETVEVKKRINIYYSIDDVVGDKYVYGPEMWELN